MTADDGRTEAKDLRVSGHFGEESPSARRGSRPDTLPRRSTRSGVVRRHPADHRAAVVGNLVRGGVNSFTSDNHRHGGACAHLPLRERLAAAHGWSREAAEARTAATHHAAWMVQLERLEAPASLLDACGAAMDAAADHARRSSLLAYALLGRDEMVAPEPEWPSPVSIPDHGAVRLALAIARHGCIASTLLAAHARAAMESCSEAAVHDLLRLTAHGADQRAAFAWRTLRWLLETSVSDGSRPILVSALESLYREGVAAHRPSASDLNAPPRLGRLGSLERARIASTVLERVVGPRFSALG